MVEQEKTSQPVSSKYYQVYDAVRALSSERLSRQLDDMFEKLEPVIIDFASKADTNNSQTYFFDIAAIVNRRRARIREQFISGLLEGFSRFRKGIPLRSEDSQEYAQHAKELRMVAHDDLEIHLAIVNIATKGKNTYHKELYQLNQRLALIRGGQPISEKDNPIGPVQLANLYQQATDVLDLDKESLLIVYMLFEKTVVMELLQLYDDVNAALADAGVYPNLWKQAVSKVNAPEVSQPEKSRSPRGEMKQQSKPSMSHVASPLTPNDFALGEEVFQSIFTFLTERRRVNPEFQSHLENQKSVDPSLLRTKDDVLGAIDRSLPTQAELATSSIVSGQSYANSADADLVHYAKLQLLNEREKVYLDLDKNTIPTADLNTIELVGMLFEEVLSDEHLANITKALICHLHTLYLKVAIADKRFLIDSTHAARRFLNLAVSAGHDWIDETRIDQGLYNPLQEMITVLVQATAAEESIFLHHLSSLQEMIQQLQNKAQLAEQRTRQAAQGKDRIEYARNRAELVISRHLNSQAIHPLIGNFLYQDWKDCMTMHLLRNPKVENSPEWQPVLEVIRILDKCNQTRGKLSEVGWLHDNLPIVEQYIEGGLKMLGDDFRPDSQALLDMLQHWSQGQFDEEAYQPQTTFSSVATENESGEAAHVDVDAFSSKEKAIYNTLKTLKLGCWFEFDEPNDQRRRVKLSWYSPITKKHMFIDRFGMKAYIIPTKKLVKKMEQGSARVVEFSELPFVDRTMLKIHDLLTT